MYQPTPTRRRQPSLEEETAWANYANQANQVSQMQETSPNRIEELDQFDPQPPGALLPPFLGKPRKQPDRKLTPQEQRDLDAEAMRIRCLGKTYRQIAFHLDISTSTAFSRVKRHLYHTRKYLHENAADMRDFQLHAIEQMLPYQIHNATHGDKKAFTLVLQAFKHQHKLSLIPNPTVKDELRRTASSGDEELARCYDPRVFEEENVGWVLAPTDAEPGAQTEVQAPTKDSVGVRNSVGASTHPTKATRTEAEQEPEQRSQGVASAAVAAGATFSGQQALGLGSAINVVCVLFLLGAATVGLACRAWPACASSRTLQNQDQESAPRGTTPAAACALQPAPGMRGLRGSERKTSIVTLRVTYGAAGLCHVVVKSTCPTLQHWEKAVNLDCLSYDVSVKCRIKDRDWYCPL